MSTFCPKSFSITVSNPVIVPVAYYKNDSVAGLVAPDSGPNGYDTDLNAGAVTLVAGQITQAYRWAFGAVRARNVTQDIGGTDLTIRFWARINTDPGFYYCHPIAWGSLDIRLSARGISVDGIGIPPGHPYSEGRPYVFSVGGSGTIWSEPTVEASVLMDHLWHRVAVRFNSTTNVLSIRVDNGTDNSAVVANPAALTGSVAYMTGCIGAGAPTNAVETCEIGLYDHYFTDAELLTDWNGGSGTTYP